MAIFNEHVIVNSGRELLGRALAGEGKIIITRAAMGDGKPNKDIKELTSLVNEKIVANVADIFNDRGTVNLKVQITNAELETPFKTEEFGIFAKIEGDEQEVLYSYCTAVEADTIPSNNGDVFIEEHTVYIAFSSDAEADIYIKEGVVFLSVETANKNYVPTGLIVEGKLSNGRTSLKENYQYQADNGKWYHNIGGNRSWRAGNGIPDELLLEISYFDIHKRLNTKLVQGNVSEEYNTGKKIEDKIKDLEQRFKNFCPFPVGSVLQMWNETNPTSLYLGTTWELISAGKYVKTGDRALQTGGTNSVTLTKDNMPNIKLGIDSFSLTIASHYHKYKRYVGYAGGDAGNAPVTQDGNGPQTRYTWDNTESAGGGNTGSASPTTETLGRGTAIYIQPEYITLKYWKRTS